jgi:hypothetical protein
MSAPAAAIETPPAAARRLAAGAIRDGFQPTALHVYRDPAGEPLFWRIRCKHPDGRKWIRPIRADDSGFELGEPEHPPAGRPLYRLPELLADYTAPVWIVEGETCADALAGLGLIATTSGSADSAGGADRAPLKGRCCIVWPDHDAAGAKYAEAVAARLRALGATVERISVTALGLPEKGDCVDWLAQHPEATAAEVLALPRVVVDDITANECEGPEPLPDKLPPVPASDPDLLPASLRPWVMDCANALQCPVEFVAVPALAALGGTIGRQVGIAVKQHERWIERPVLWATIVGRPSSGKSPALAPVQRMLTRLESDRRDDWEHAARDARVDAELFAAEQAGAKKKAAELLRRGDRGGARAALDLPEPPAALPPPRLVVNDATVEKLGELLNENPRGLVQFRDELAGWLASLDREGRETDRGFWLECWGGRGPYTCDRIGRGTVRIEACAVAIIGGIQPGKLAEYVRGAIRGGLADDGLAQRLQLAVYPDTPPGWRWSDRALNPEGEERAWATFRRLDRLDAELIGAERAAWCDVPFIRLDDAARDLFAEWQTSLMQRLRTGAEPPCLESHLGKYPATAARLALVLHLAEHPSGPVGVEAMTRALAWLEFLEPHAHRLYNEATAPGVAAAHLLIAKRRELPEAFTLRDVYRRHWAGLDRHAAEEAAELLVEYGHLTATVEETGGRPTVNYRWRAPA